MARPSIYSLQIIDDICERIAEGESLLKICANDGMPALRTVMYWLDDPERSEFLQKYTRAREIQADVLAEQILEIADDGRNDRIDADGQQITDHDVIARSRLRVDARKWYAGKVAPKKYGDRVDINNTHGGTVRVHVSAAEMSDDDHAAIAAGKIKLG